MDSLCFWLTSGVPVRAVNLNVRICAITHCLLGTFGDIACGFFRLQRFQQHKQVIAMTMIQGIKTPRAIFTALLLSPIKK